MTHKPYPIEVKPISAQTCKKMVKRNQPFTGTYLTTLNGVESGIGQDMPFFVRWIGERDHWEAQFIAIGPTGKYGTAIVNQALYDNVQKVVYRHLGIKALTGIKTEEMHTASLHNKTHELFPDLNTLR